MNRDLFKSILDWLDNAMYSQEDKEDTNVDNLLDRLLRNGQEELHNKLMAYLVEESWGT